MGQGNHTEKKEEKKAKTKNKELKEIEFTHTLSTTSITSTPTAFLIKRMDTKKRGKVEKEQTRQTALAPGLFRIA